MKNFLPTNVWPNYLDDIAQGMGANPPLLVGFNHKVHGDKGPFDQKSAVVAVVEAT
jgi:hypothetical protein